MNDARLEMAAHKERRERDLRVHGKLSAEAEAQSKRLSDRAAFLSEMIARHPGVGAAPALLAADASEVRAKAEALLERHRGEADALRSKHRAEDDARAAEADAANRKIAAAEESVRLRAEQRDAQRRRADHIADELATHAVSDEAVEDVRARAAEAERLFEERRGAGVAAAATAELERVAETTDQLDRQLSKLRAEQDRAAAAGENATKVRLKREELFAKEEAYRALADSRAGRFATVFLCDRLRRSRPGKSESKTQRVHRGASGARDGARRRERRGRRRGHRRDGSDGVARRRRRARRRSRRRGSRRGRRGGSRPANRAADGSER